MRTGATNPMRLACSTSASFFVFLLSAAALTSEADLQNADDVISRMNRVLREQESELRQYSVHRRYILHNHLLDPDTTMTVFMKYDAKSGKQFTITGSEHLGGVSQRVLRNILEAERSASKERPSRSEINRQHYSFSFGGIETRNGRRCYRIGLKPRERSRYLLDGLAWIDTTEFALVRVEGSSSRPLSFWIGRSQVQWDYGKFDHFWLPAHHRSVAQVKLAGESELEIEYFTYQFPASLRSNLVGHLPAVIRPATPQ